MQYRKAQRWLAGILCACMLLVSALSTAYLTVHAGHRCADQVQCHVCLAIHQGEELLKQIRTAPLWAVAATAVVWGLVLALACGRREERGSTPLVLKVRLNQ